MQKKTINILVHMTAREQLVLDKHIQSKAIKYGTYAQVQAMLNKYIQNK